MYEPNSFYFYVMCGLIILCFVLLVAIVLMILQYIKYKKKLKKFLTLNSYAKDIKNDPNYMNKVSGYFGKKDDDLNEDLLFADESPAKFAEKEEQ